MLFSFCSNWCQHARIFPWGPSAASQERHLPAAEATPDQVFLAADASGGLLLCLVSRHTMQLQALQLILQPRGGDVARATVCF